MPRKKGLGKGVEKALQDVDELIKCLEKFSKTNRKTIKKVVSSAFEKEDKEPLLKQISETNKLATTLSDELENIVEKVKEIKPKGNSRFAREVVTRFLEGRP